MAKLYPNIKTEHRIVDIATAQVASKPQSYDVIVTLNLYGDIISDVAAEVVSYLLPGSVFSVDGPRSTGATAAAT